MKPPIQRPPIHLGPFGWFSPVHLFTFCIFGVMATANVHMPLYEKTLTFSGTQIGSMAALFVLSSVMIPPIWGYIMDRVTDPRRVLRIAVVGSTLFLLPCLWVSSLGAYFLFRLLSSCFQTGLIPINDSQTLAYGSKYQLKYGPIRAWGSYGFIVGQLLLACLFLFVDTIRWMFVPWALYCGVMLAATWWLEPLPSGLKRGEFLKGLRLFWDRTFVVFCMGFMLQRVAMMGYYTFFSIYLFDLGLPFSITALAWCIGPISEIAVIYFGDRLVDRMGVKSLLLWALGGGMIRLLILASAPPTWMIMLSQLLHALTFGALHIAGVMYVNHQIPASIRASGQSVFNAVGLGVSGAAGNFLAGKLYDTYGPQGMLYCLAAVALVGWIFVATLLRPVKITAA